MAAGAVKLSSSVVVWLVAGPGLREAELEIGRLRERGWREGWRAGAQAQAVEDATAHVGLVEALA